MKTFLLFFTLVTLFGCTSNERARNFGGTETIVLEPNIRLVNATWKGANLWIIVKKDSSSPSTYYFKEKSNWGLQEGQIIIIEK
jgi:hypothetical protein